MGWDMVMRRGGIVRIMLGELLWVGVLSGCQVTGLASGGKGSSLQRSGLARIWRQEEEVWLGLCWAGMSGA